MNLLMQDDASSTVHAPPGFLAWVADTVHAHRARLIALARGRGLSADDALDAVQDAFTVFLRIPQARSIAADSDDAVKLLMVIVKHQCLNRRRSERRRDRAEAAMSTLLEIAAAPDSEALIAHAEELARVKGCILRMAKLQRSVVTLSLLDAQPHQDVAAQLGISEAYARTLLHRAREHIRTCAYEHDAAPEA
jgi:RNA polymerase sigma-70 factor (ECF subfamily)